jgi:hypothetical protein
VGVEKLIPILRDLVFLAAGTYVFVQEARSDARWAVMVLGMVFAAGPVAIQAYWGSLGRSQVPGSSDSSPPSSLSPSSSPSPSPASGDPQ